MSRVKSKNTALEKKVCSSLFEKGLRFRKHVRTLPGTPDIVFPKVRLAIFVDGDFWHGYRFPSWRFTMSDFWQKKISMNRVRDRRNFAKLRRMGWKVIRIWQHEIEKNPSKYIDRVILQYSSLASPKYS